MKRILSVTLLLLTLLFVSCSDDDTTNPSDDNNITNPLTKEGMQYKVDGAPFTQVDCKVLSHTPVRDYFTVVSPNSTGIQLRTLPDKTGTYENTVGDNLFRRYNVWFKHGSKMYYADNDRGNAKITLTEVGKMGENGTYNGIVKGYFSGTFVNEDKTEITVTDGYFWAVQPDIEK
ncbi:MAG: hypothetical protein R2863_09795 [Candidatus Kapaibacterium sp.]|nr:hypothetical protein [Ignavibacteriota bacterium]MCB9221313.1 hypothetical protein [Ignavibacteria bacterium]